MGNALGGKTMDDQEGQPNLLRWELGMKLSTETDKEYQAATARLAKELMRDYTPEQLAIITAQHVIYLDDLTNTNDSTKRAASTTAELVEIQRAQLQNAALENEVLVKETVNFIQIALNEKKAKTTRKRMPGLDRTNQKKNEIAGCAREIATELWAKDTEGLRIGDMADRVYRALAAKGFTKEAGGLPETTGTVGAWIKSVAPDYASKGGRSRKTS
jgi:hypothetical protein